MLARSKLAHQGTRPRSGADCLAAVPCTSLQAAQRAGPLSSSGEGAQLGRWAQSPLSVRFRWRGVCVCVFGGGGGICPKSTEAAIDDSGTSKDRLGRKHPPHGQPLPCPLSHAKLCHHEWPFACYGSRRDDAPTRCGTPATALIEHGVPTTDSERLVKHPARIFFRQSRSLTRTGVAP